MWSRGFQKLDVVALTRAHQDHLGGLLAILDNFRIGQLWIGREVHSAVLARPEQLAREKNIPIEHETSGNGLVLDDVEGEIFWPEKSSLIRRLRRRMPIRLCCGCNIRGARFYRRVMRKKEAERGILSENGQDELQAEVLKVGHHGGRNSTTSDFLAAVPPRLGIISVREGNSYGHPSADLLARLENAGVRVLRTDRDGAVHILMDRNGVEVRCFVPCLPVGVDGLRAQAPNHHKNEQQ